MQPQKTSNGNDGHESSTAFQVDNMAFSLSWAASQSTHTTLLSFPCPAFHV
ncbi:hypothetical protein DAPPUDRAFT_249093 [Daphnia pulex]|uniref:Uncharacterized protein n=1 Tax=Daphnia pulex TaxID=6669 RepID=E9GVU4_DAPPU|nr:hypothetical protein DAPPUDRAFT_249093 [Daphnia pulex]|eukprot:EFX76238.1 hypothetical protein DAPPUDRAFT_249093 [Daphnia pulex]